MYPMLGGIVNRNSWRTWQNFYRTIKHVVSEQEGEPHEDCTHILRASAEDPALDPHETFAEEQTERVGHATRHDSERLDGARRPIREDVDRLARAGRRA